MSSGDPRTDRAILTSQYGTDENLAVRYRIHERYSRPVIDFQRWVLDAIAWSGDEWVLDLGCGPGTYFAGVAERAPRGRHVAGDLSFGMTQRARANEHAGTFAVLNLDAMQLPFPDGTFHVVLANHMLYHIAVLPGALAEIRRVLKPDGLLVAGTNSEDNLPELDTLTRRACALLGVSRLMPKMEFGFSLEHGPAQLGRYFRAVARYDLPGAFHFPEVDPVLDYINSMRTVREAQLPSGVSWADFISMMEKQITRLIRHFGELRVRKLAGVVVATNGGGFARDYLARLDATR